MPEKKKDEKPAAAEKPKAVKPEEAAKPVAAPKKAAAATPLQFGDEGEAVTELQNSLVNWGMFGTTCVTGIFDVNTREALGQFQESQNLERTEVLDAETKKALGSK